MCCLLIGDTAIIQGICAVGRWLAGVLWRGRPQEEEVAQPGAIDRARERTYRGINNMTLLFVDIDEVKVVMGNEREDMVNGSSDVQTDNCNKRVVNECITVTY